MDSRAGCSCHTQPAVLAHCSLVVMLTSTGAPLSLSSSSLLHRTLTRMLFGPVALWSVCGVFTASHHQPGGSQAVSMVRVDPLPWLPAAILQRKSTNCGRQHCGCCSTQDWLLHRQVLAAKQCIFLSLILSNRHWHLFEAAITKLR